MTVFFSCDECFYVTGVFPCDWGCFHVTEGFPCDWGCFYVTGVEWQICMFNCDLSFNIKIKRNNHLGLVKTMNKD